MNRKQYFALAWCCLFIGLFFIVFDLIQNKQLDDAIDSAEFSQESILTINESIINAEIYEPFIWMFSLLWIVFTILGVMEKK